MIGRRVSSGAMTFSIKTLGITTFGMALKIKCFFAYCLLVTFVINGTQHKTLLYQVTFVIIGTQHKTLLYQVPLC
jgi:hypothetical protein